MTTGQDQIEADEDALMRAAERMQEGVARFREFPPEDLTRIQAFKFAEENGLRQNTVLNARRELVRAGYETLTKKSAQRPEERHDADFWRRKCKALRKDLDALHARVKDLAALDGLRIRAPSWQNDYVSGSRGSAVLIVHNSDRHMDEVIEADEINGWNRYNREIATIRIKRFMDAACELGSRWTVDTQVTVRCPMTS